MILRRKKEGESVEFNNSGISIDKSPTVSYIKNVDLIQEEEYPHDLRRRSFYWALGGRPKDILIGEVKEWHTKQTELQNNSIGLEIAFIEEEIDTIKIEIVKETEKLSEVKIITNEQLELKVKLEADILILKTELENIVDEIGRAHTDLIKNRLKEVKEELKLLVEIYNEIFKEKFGEEKDYKEAIDKQIKISDDLIKKTEDVLTITSEALKKNYRYGTSKLSSRLLIITGFFSAIASGWFFSIFMDQNMIDNQNWLFFVLTNMFNYLGLYVQEYGQFDAAKYMLISFVALTIGLTFIIYFCETFLNQSINNKPGIELALEYSHKRKRRTKFNISSNSLFSIWLKLLPWFFFTGILIIIIAVGQTVGEETEQIKKLGQHLSGQVIGTIITLICTGLLFLYITKVIEPRKIQIDDKQEHRKRGNRELGIVIIAVNILLVLIVSTQLFNSIPINKQAILSIICFILLVDVTAFTLSYGVRSSGLIKTNEEAQQKIISLSNYRKVLSANKPIHIWIQEDRQFNKKFLAIQRELFELMQLKNNSHKQFTKKKFIKIPSFISSLKKTNALYKYNFPGLSIKLEEKRKGLRAKKEILKEVDITIEELREGRSDFHLQISEEVRQFEDRFKFLKYKKRDLELNKAIIHNQLEEKRMERESQLTEGYQLGTWMKNTIMKQP